MEGRGTGREGKRRGSRGTEAREREGMEGAGIVVLGGIDAADCTTRLDQQIARTAPITFSNAPN